LIWVKSLIDFRLGGSQELACCCRVPAICGAGSGPMVEEIILI
jgi:hypothetical protein